MSQDKNAPKGGGFFLEKAGNRAVAIPEELSEDVRELGNIAQQFNEKVVLPRAAEFEDPATKVKTNIEVMKQAGEQGLLCVEIPEEYGGLGLPLSAATYLAEKISQYGSFTVSLLCHTGIGTLPLLFFGNKEQKEKYLPLLGSGEWFAAYALTEANYGSDALGAKTKAVLSPDGKNYILNGEKIYITNGGFADLFTVYAKVDGEHFSAFLVEKNFPGLSIGAEEHKMGIKGSSTTSVILEDCVVPVENLLGKIGEGHKSALGVLDIGRFKLGVGVMGNAKRMEMVAAKYANERVQFKRPIGQFGMIRRKFADMSARLFAVESMGYRTAGLIDDEVHHLDSGAEDYIQQVGKVFEEYDIECAIIKVLGSETAAFVIDEAVQVHGGAGFIEEYETARAYRDERINRIFEGTNEINRLLIPATLLKRSMTGRLPVMPDFMKLLAKLKTDEDLIGEFEGRKLPQLLKVVEGARQQTLYGFGSTIRKFMAQLQKADFVMGMGEYFFEKISNMVMALFAMESSVMRAEKLIEKLGEDKAKNAIQLATLAVSLFNKQLQGEAVELMTALAGTDTALLADHQKVLNRLSVPLAIDIMTIKDEVAMKVLDQERYVV